MDLSEEQKNLEKSVSNVKSGDELDFYFIKCNILVLSLIKNQQKKIKKL